MPVLSQRHTKETVEHFGVTFARGFRYILEKRLSPYLMPDMYPRNLLYTKLWDAMLYMYKDIERYMPQFRPLYVQKGDTEFYHRSSVDLLFDALPMREVFDTTRMAQIVVADSWEPSVLYTILVTRMPMPFLPLSNLITVDPMLSQFAAQALALHRQSMHAKSLLRRVIDTYNVSDALGLMPHLAARVQKYKRLPKTTKAAHSVCKERLLRQEYAAASKLYGDMSLAVLDNPNWMHDQQCTVHVNGPIVVGEAYSSRSTDGPSHRAFEAVKIVLNFVDMMRQKELHYIMDRYTLNKEVLSIFREGNIRAHSNVDVSAVNMATSKAVAEFQWFM